MDNWQPGTLSWSFSKQVHFNSCRRHYFYHRFWGQDHKLRWRLFEMRNLTTLTMLRGQVVHTVIAKALNAVRYGEKVNTQIAKQSITDILRSRYMESAKKLWHISKRPEGKKAFEITSILEHYYNFPNINERAREAQQVAWQCMMNLIESEFWRKIADSDPALWMTIDESGFPSFDLDGIKVYTTIDFAHASGSPEILDWKTGSESDGRRQLTLYSLYAQAKWGWNPLETKLSAVYLYPELKVDTFFATQDDIEAIKDEVKQSFDEMQNVEPAYGPADVNLFPMTGSKTDCRWCRFQGVCEKLRERGG